MQLHTRAFTAALVLAASTAAPAQTKVQGAWVRGTVAQQAATGLFAQLTSVRGGKLVSVSTPAAGIAEIHQMTMDGDTMRMRPVPALDLPAGQRVELKPGGFHVMLMDLKRPLKAGDTVAVTLVVEGADKQRERLELQVPVKAPGTDHRHP